MTMNSDTLTTVLGAAGAVIVAAQPVVNTVGGSVGQDDLVKLALAVIMALFGFFTNKAKVAG